MAKKLLEFDCPMCGNPLPRIDRKKVRCPWCKTLITPQGFKLKQEAEIYQFEREKADEES